MTRPAKSSKCLGKIRFFRLSKITMKLCPNCKTTYSDDTLRFCLTDGTSLIPTSTAAEKTVEMSGGTNQMRFDTPTQSVPTIVSPVKTETQAARSGINPWFIFLPVLALLFLAVAGLLGYILLRPEKVVVSNTATPTPTSTPPATPTPDKETAALKEELESLKKQIEDQKNPSKNDSTARPFPTENPSAPAIQTARVNSPNDGFLALRSIPDTGGIMLAKIPHGTNIEIIGCQKNATQKPGKRRGRWCRTDYNGQSGWVFDAFLSY